VGWTLKQIGRSITYTKQAQLHSSVSPGGTEACWEEAGRRRPCDGGTASGTAPEDLPRSMSSCGCMACAGGMPLCAVCVVGKGVSLRRRRDVSLRCFKPARREVDGPFSALNKATTSTSTSTNKPTNSLIVTPITICVRLSCFFWFS